MKYLHILFLLIVLAVPFASAEFEVVTYETRTGFSAISPALDLALCQCETRADTITITNTGVYASRYTLASNQPDYVSFTENVVEVLPGKSRQVYAYIQAPCDARFEKGLIYEIVDVFSNQQFIEKTFSVNECQNLEATLYADQESPIKPCTPVTYSLEIFNSGVFTETYDVSFGTLEQEEVFSSSFQSIIIPAQSSGTVESTLEFDCNTYGNFSIPVEVEAQVNGLITDFVHELVIEPDFDFDLDVESDDVCALDNSSFTLIIENEGGFDNNFTITMAEHGFASMNVSEVLILEGDEFEIPITLSPGIEDVGSSSIFIEVTDAIAGVTKNISVEFQVNNCHKIEIDILREENVKDCSYRQEIPVLVKNAGSVKEEITLSAQGPYAWTDSEFIVLDANESYEFNLILDVPITESVFDTIIVFASTNQVSDEDSILVDLLSDYRCSQIVAETNKAWFKYGKADARGSIFLRHDGLVAGNYDIIYTGSNFMELDEYTERIYFAPGDIKEVYFDGYANETIFNETNTYHGTLTIYSEEGFEYTIPFEGKTYKDNVFKRAYQFFKNRTCLLASIIILALIIVSIIALSALPKAKKNLPWLITSLVILWVIIVAVQYGVNGLPTSMDAPLPEAQGDLDFIMAEDSVFTLNMSDFFVDPDNDNLSYNVSPMDNVETEVFENTITFTPEKDWFGERRFRVSAYDGDENTRSPRLNLFVIDRPEYTLYDYYTKYCMTINLVLLILCFVLIYLVVLRLVARCSKKKEKKAPEQSRSASVKRTSVKKKSAKKKSTKKKSAKKK